MRKHIVTLFFMLCTAAAQAASKWPDHEWLVGSTGVAWSHPTMSGGYPRMEIWFVFRGSELYLPLPLIPFFIALFLALLGFYGLWACRHRPSRT